MIRIDKLLWFLRLAASRSLARQWIETGHIRINGRRIVKCATSCKSGDILTLPLTAQVWVIEILTVPARRGPLPEAQACYRTLDEHCANPIAASEHNLAKGT